MSTSNWPTEAGLYFAKGEDSSHHPSKLDPSLYPWVVEVGGMAPFLRISAIWMREKKLLRQDPVPGSGMPDTIIFGPRIRQPGEPREILAEPRVPADEYEERIGRLVVGLSATAMENELDSSGVLSGMARRLDLEKAFRNDIASFLAWFKQYC